MLSLRKKALVLGMAAVMAMGFAACAKSEPEPAATPATQATQASEQTQASQDASQNDPYYFEINGYKLRIGEVYEDIKDKLGKEIKPAEDIGACDPQGRSDYEHYYDGVDVTVHFDGRVTRLYVDGENSGSASLAGKLHVGDKADQITAMFGPADEPEAPYYRIDGSCINFNVEGGEILSIDLSDPENA